MNEFKKAYKVEESTLYDEVKKRVEEDKEGKIKREPKKVDLSNEIVNGIFSFYNRVLTEEEKKKILEMDEKSLPGTIPYLVCCMAKQYIKTGEVSQEFFNECCRALEKDKKIFELEKIDAKLSKDPSTWNEKDEESEQNDAR